MANNTPQLWDKLWTAPVSTEEDLFKLAQEENTIRWQRLERIVLNTFGAFDGLRWPCRPICRDNLILPCRLA